MFAGAPPARLVLDGKPLDVDPDGNARWLVRARFVDAHGAPTELLGGGDVTFVPSRGSAQWQTRLRFGGPAAIVSTVGDGPLAVTVRAAVGPRVPAGRLVTDTRRWSVPRIAGHAIGPHAVAIGWFPRVVAGVVRVVRTGDTGAMVSDIAAPSSGMRDERVAPGSAYEYEIDVPGRAPHTVHVDVPPDPAHGAVTALTGKAVWLSFSPSTRDADGYDKIDPAAVVARARAAGLRAIVLRTTYGPFDEITPDDEPIVDALIDGAAAAGIRVVAWTVPRSTRFEDVAADVAAARYLTSHGNGFAALAVDLERGGYFMGDGAAGYGALAAYLRQLRVALGPGYPLIATVEDPALEHLTRSDYPYDAIGADADALQPMVYWRIAAAAATPRAVREIVRASYEATLREAGRSLPVVVGLQSGAFGSTGAPRPSEILAGVASARELGALGVTFFDWNGTSAAGWDAIARARW